MKSFSSVHTGEEKYSDKIEHNEKDRKVRAVGVKVFLIPN